MAGSRRFHWKSVLYPYNRKRKKISKFDLFLKILYLYSIPPFDNSVDQDQLASSEGSTLFSAIQQIEDLT